ncbi:unnamed protein product [Tuber aestivum]|uniref:Uncharacterized protein n=1 Tax=Tuber aestivum TaxID=59557 RepID=A0A292PLW2_9PEZI|nr:unnamed protein product [Tuber aestivum]
MFRVLNKRPFKQMGARNHPAQNYFCRQSSGSRTPIMGVSLVKATLLAVRMVQSTPQPPFNPVYSPSAFATLEQFAQLEKNQAVMNCKIDYLESSMDKPKAGLKDLRDKMERDAKDINDTVDKKDSRMGAKVDRWCYVIVGGLIAFSVKGGFGQLRTPESKLCSDRPEI